MPREADGRKQERSRGWVLTIFSLDRDTVPAFPESDYSIAGRENAPDTGRFHWQCYAHWPTLRSFEQTKSLFPTAHIEKAKADAHKNRRYCAKGGDFVETGTPPQQGKRSDLCGVTDMLAAGASPATIARIYPSHVLRLHSKFRGYLDLIDKPPKQRDVTVKVFWGPTGTGKTRKVVEEAPDVYWVPYWDGKRLWMDAYDGQKAICLDDFDGSLDLRILLHLTDRYTRQYPVKGGFITARWDQVYITSDQHPSGWYDTVLHYSQLKRRISLITHFVEPIGSGGAA